MDLALGLALAALLTAGCSDDRPLAVIVLTTENMWMHPSNAAAAQALVNAGTERGWNISATDDPDVFTAATLRDTDVVVFSVTSGSVLDDDARRELEKFWTSGGGYVGTHSASATEADWPFYRELVPVTFRTHPIAPPIQVGRLTVETAHPIVSGVPDPWLFPDEFYTFHERPEELGLELLLALDESAMGPEYTANERVGYHPLAFTHDEMGGRAFYTALGHSTESYADPVFMGMLLAGIEWAAR